MTTDMHGSDEQKDLVPVEFPELIFGLVGPIGVDLETVTDCLASALDDFDYEAKTIRITDLMREFKLGKELDAPGYIDSFKQRIEYANEVRRKTKCADALAIMAISALRAHRQEVNGSPNEACEKTAYIIRQFKRPEEVQLLRRVYGKQFIQISAYAPQSARIASIAKRHRDQSGGQIELTDAQNEANSLVKQDEKESHTTLGQNVRDAFPLADLFVETSDRKSCVKTIERFVNSLFGDNETSPSHDEYGMYLAKSASLRSSALTRQVGAAIFRQSGEVISLGCNEVPKAGGGTYWHGDKGDYRDFVGGHDPNDKKKKEVLIDLVDRLLKTKRLNHDFVGNQSAAEVASKLLEDETNDGVSESRLMDLLEFGRDIHAEMSAITDAARKGVSIERATLYCTTFPCHMCAKHIIAAGIARVVYIEPFPKSYAEELHADAIILDDESICSKKVNFVRFTGVSPYRYRDLFEKGKRKYSTGKAKRWNKQNSTPMIEVISPNYFRSEALVVEKLKPHLPAADKSP